jgi:phosphate transport system substrate-binding protein
VAPTQESIASFDYPLSRPLFIYVSLNRLAENPALGEFVDFYLSPEGISAVSEAGYVELSDEEFAGTVEVWESAS